MVILLIVWKRMRSNIGVEECKNSHLGQCMRPFRRSRRWNGNLRAQWMEKLNLRGVIFISLLCAGHAMDAQQASQILNQMADLASSATRAATASTAALDAFQKNQEEHRSRPRPGDFTKILKKPDNFLEDDPVKFMGWREQFVNWISFIDKRYVELFDEAERLTTEVKMEDFTDESKELAQQLYSILSSYLRGPAGQLVRGQSSSRNGFRVWQELLKLYLPRTRPRTMALGQAIIQHPPFGSSKSMTESLLQFDQLLEQYEVASGSKMPDDLVVSTILKCVDGVTRKHLQLTMDESTTYSVVKERLILYDRNSRTWSGESIMKSLQDQYRGGADSSGPVPMEVDYVGYKGKGKGKKGNEGKGKKGSWSNGSFPFGGKWGKGSKGKGKKGGRKGKHGGKKGGGKKGGGKLGKGTCRICHEQGHWGNECPTLVNQLLNRGNSSRLAEISLVAMAVWTSPTSTVAKMVRGLQCQQLQRLLLCQAVLQQQFDRWECTT